MTSFVRRLTNVNKDDSQQDGVGNRDSVTKEFLTTLGTKRPISRPIKVKDSGRKPPKHPTADEYEIPYDPQNDANHPYEKWRRNRYLRCLVTREIARYLDRKTFVTVSVREALTYSIFLVLLFLITSGSFTLEKFYLAETMRERYTDSFPNINTLQHVWDYQSDIINNKLYEPFWNTPDQNYENKILGVAIIRQLRVKKGTCKVWDAVYPKGKAPECYGPYTMHDEEKEKIGKPSRALTERLAKVNIWLSPNITGALPYSGILTTYGGGGYAAYLYDKDDAAQLIVALNSLKWYTRATRAIFMEFTIYNGNSNLFCIFKLLFEIPTTGGVIPSARIYVKQLIRYDNGDDFLILGYEIICMVFIIFYTIQKILEIFTLRLKLFKSFWNYIDLMVLVMSYMTFAYNLMLYNKIEEMLPNVEKNYDEFIYISFDVPLHLHIMYSRCFAALIAFAYLRLLKYFNVIKSMHQLMTTMHRAIPEMLGYFTLFLYLYFVFALVGVFLFGSKLEHFKTFPIALFSLMRYSIADFQSSQLTQTDAVMGPLFFYAYIFLIVFTLANMFLAILVTKYQEVRSEVRIGGAKTFLKDMLMIWFLQLLGKMECPWLLSQIEREEFEEKVKSPTEHVRYYLRQAGYSELEIELFFKKYDITDSKIEAMDENRINYRKGEREAPPPLSQKDIMRYIVIQKLEYLENHYKNASKLIDDFLNKLNKLDRKATAKTSDVN